MAQQPNQSWISITPIKEEPSSFKERRQKIKIGSGDTSYLIIKRINVFGNNRTHKDIVLRELNLYPGDTIYSDVQNAFLEEKRQRLLNSSLFLSVHIYPVRRGTHQVVLNIEVLERQYFLVLPTLGLADRNFNVWWVKHHHKLNRLNYGLKVYENNLTGNKDRLSAGVTLGYTQRFDIAYEFPYFDKSYKQGFGIEATYRRNKELNYGLDSNAQKFLKTGNYVKKYFRIGLNYSYKKNIRLKHRLSLSYNSLKVADSVLKLNPSYFLNNQNKQKYFELNYHFSYIGTDIWAYPLHGYQIEANLSRKGLGLLGNVNETELVVKGSKYWELYDNVYLENDFTGSLRLPAHQPFSLLEGMGYYGRYLKGMEYYVMDGNYFTILSNSLKKRLFAFRVHSRFLPEEFGTIPFQIYFKIYGDIGYNHSHPKNPTDMFSNKFLYSYGLGLDIVSFYDAVLRVEFSMNQLGENGVFLHFKSSF